MTGAGSRSLPKLRGFGAVLVVAAGAAVAQSFGRFTYGVLLKAIRDDLGISNTVAGSLGTVNVGAYLLGTLVVASATGRFRLLDVMKVGFVLSSLGLLLAAVANGPWILGVSLFLTGMGGATIWIPAPVIAADALAPERRGIAVGLMGSGIGVGIVFTGQLSGWVRSALGDAEWRTVYVVEAGIGLIVLLITLFFLDHQQDRPGAGRSGFGGFSSLRRMPGWLPLTLAYTSFGFMYLLVIGFLTTRLEDDSGWSSSESSLAFTLVGVAIIFGGPLFITFASRVGPRIALSTAFSMWSFLVIGILPGWFAPTLALSVGLGFVFSGIPGMITLYVVENTTIEHYGPSFAAATLAFGVAQMLAPQVGGLLADITGSFALLFWLSAGLALTGTAASLRLPRRPA